MKKITFILVILWVTLFGIPHAFASSVFYDSFDKDSIDTNKWTVSDTSGNLDLWTGDLRLRGGTGTYGQQSLYGSVLDRVAGRALINSVRGTVSSAAGPVMHFATSINPANPDQNGYGISEALTGGGAPLLRLNSIVPGAQVPYSFNTSGDTSQARSIDYLTLTILRPTGSYHLISGGIFGTYPQATLIWANDHGTDNQIYPGINNKSSTGFIHQTNVIDLTGSFAQQNGLAVSYDSFDRADSTNLGSTEIGSQTWTEAVGNWEILSDRLKLSSSGGDGQNLAVISGAGSDGIFETNITTPSSGIDARLIFRYIDSNNFLMASLNGSNLFFYSRVSGSFTAIASTPFATSPNTTYRLRVIAHGTQIMIYINDDLKLTRSSSVNQAGTGAGVGVFSSDTGSVFGDFAVWPKTVTLPSTLDGLFPTIPASGSTTIASDTFTDTNGTLLQDHTMNTGSGWTIVGPSWSIDSNKTSPSSNTGGAIALTEAGTTNMSVSADITLPEASAGTTEWFSGLVYRYVDTNNYSYCRFLWQSASPEIELWDIVDGASNGSLISPPGFINATNITGQLSEGSTHTLNCSVVGDQVSAYMDGTLIVQGKTVRTEGTKGGLTINAGSSVTTPYSTFDNFALKSTETDAVPPPAVDSLSADSGSSTPSLNWTTVYDDAIGTKNYNIYRSLSAGSLGNKINGDTTTSGSYTDSSLSSPGTYYYTVRAVDNAGNESDSDDNNQLEVVYNSSGSSVSASTSSSSFGPPGCSDLAPIEVPDLFQITAASDSARLHFTSTRNTSGYSIVYGFTPADARYGSIISSNNAWLMDSLISNLSSNTKYYFKVQPLNGCNAGNWSNIISITTPKGKTPATFYKD